MPNMKLITLKMPAQWLQDLDGLVRRRLYSSRSDAIRAAVRDLLKEESWEKRRP